MLIYAVVLIVMMLFNWSPKAIEWKERIKEKYFSGFQKKAVAEASAVKTEKKEVK